MKRFHYLTLSLLAAVSAPAFSQTTADAALVPAVATASVSFRVYLPLRNEAGLDALLKSQQTAGSPSYHKWLTPAEFGKRFGPAPEAIESAKAAIQKAGLSVTDVGTTSLQVAGTVGGANKLLGTSLGNMKGADGRSRMVAMAKPTMMPELKALGATVVAFSTVPPHRPFATKANAKLIPNNRYGAYGALWFTDLKQAYDYPAYTSRAMGGGQLDGTGVSAALLMADLIYPDDLPALFNHEKFTDVGGGKIPKVKTVKIDGGGTQGGPAAFEASLDVQEVAGGAPGANVTLVSLPDLSDQSITDGYQYIVDQNTYDVVSSSFGECELFYTADYNNGTDYTGILKQYDTIFKQGNAQGITFLASSGDNGGLECTELSYLKGKKGKFIKGISTPAASAYVTAVGGTNVETTDDSGTSPLKLNSEYVGENGYGDPLVGYDPYGTGGTATGGYWGAGGGISTIFKIPDYQKGVNTGSKKFRTVPDIGMQVGGCPNIAKDAANGCDGTRSAAVVAYDTAGSGGFYGVIGTSVSSPEFAGAVALDIQQTGGRLGNLNPFLYSQGAAQTAAGGVSAPASSQFYHRNIPGFDGVYHDTDPSVNYNYIVGNGTPDIRVLFGMTQLKAAGVPQTKTNP